MINLFRQRTNEWDEYEQFLKIWTLHTSKTMGGVQWQTDLGTLRWMVLGSDIVKPSVHECLLSGGV